MKKQKLSLFLALPFILTGCGNNESNSTIGLETTYIHVLNAEDYMDMSLLTSFEDYIYERDNKKVKVVYDTYDTNETMYNTLKTGKTTYDLVCCSDYMIQRLAREDLLHLIDYSLLPNYSNYGISYLSSLTDNSGKLNQLTVTNSDGNYTMKDYSVGYMWGTLGILYNPNYILKTNSSFFNNNKDWKDLTSEERKEKIIETFSGKDGYSFIYNEAVEKTQSIKDSMRDSFALGNLEVFKDFYLDESKTYEEKSEKFNDCSDETIKLIENNLIGLKDHIFGFETDSGKNDIVTEKIGVNLAWSGDAVNSINRGHYADDDWTIERDNEIELYYSLPSLGGNIWMDCFATPTQKDESYYDSDTYKYSLEFLDYLCEPDNAILNVSYNGYTSFITSKIDNDFEETYSMLAYMLYSYDLSEGDEDNNLDDYDLYDITPFFNISDDVDEIKVDLSYVSETLMEDEEVDDRIFTFKRDENGEFNILIHTEKGSFENRLLTAQYPSKEQCESLYVMNDYGSQNDKIVEMWENVKVNPLPLWIRISLLSFVVVVLVYLGSYQLIRKYKLNKRKKYREQK